MENAVGQKGIRQHFERSGPQADSARISSPKKSAATSLAMVLFLVVLTIAGSFSVGSGGAGHLAAPLAGTPAAIPAAPVVRMDVGAGVLGPYGLVNPRALQMHAPIDISGNSQWTSANGVRYGAGTTNNPYVIENWSITQSTCNYAAGIQIHGNSTVYAIIRNNWITNACTNSSGGGITLGTTAYPPAYNADRGDNILVTRNEVHANANGIHASYSTNNDTMSYNAVYMNASGSHYAVTCQGGTYYCKIIGNYIDARSGQSCSGTSCTVWTQGIEIGDYDQPTWYRKAAYAVAAYNTITNATVAGILVDPCYRAQIYSNLVYQNYPGRRPTYIGGNLWPDRGILVEGDAGSAGVSNWSQVHDNVALNYTNGIEAYSFAGWYWNNTVLNNVGYGIYVDTNASGTTWGHWTDYNVFWNNHGSGNVNGLYRIPSGGYTTVLDMTGTPTTTSFPLSFTNQGNRVITNASYSWAGTALNVSYNLAANGLNEPAVTTYYVSTGLSSQNLSGYWWGPSLALALDQFTTSDIQYTITSATNATFQASGLVAAAYFQVYRAGNLQATVSTSIAGTLSYSSPAPASDSYEIRFLSTIAVPNPPGSATNSTIPTVRSVAYMPDASAVDIAFTQPMNQSSVETSVAVYPGVNYSLQWVNESHVRIVFNSALLTGSTYEVVLQPSAKTASGTSLQQPFVFQFSASGTGSTTASVTATLPIAIIAVALLIVNWATAGYLIVHYRKNASRVKSRLNQLTHRYAGSVVVVYKKLAHEARRTREADRKVVPKAKVRKSLSNRPVTEARKAPMKPAEPATPRWRPPGGHR